MSLDRIWYQPHPARWLLWPVSLLYDLASRLRRLCYRLGWLRSERMPVPVIVVGNITVGGTGKTPLVVWLVEQLRARGWRPGIISRGYGGHSRLWPREVTPDSDPTEVGDEPVLLAQRLRCPVVVGPSRIDDARQLLAGHGVDIIVSDDGLQHYALHRDIEIAVMDGRRKFGNGMLLPAGPLREHASRLRDVQWVVINGADGRGTRMDLVPDFFARVDGRESQPVSAFRGREVHAVAGIGHPERFFDSLRLAGLKIRPHYFPDHHQFVAADVSFPDNIDVVMTEKDAVKCRAFAGPRHWTLIVQARLAADAGRRLDALLSVLPK
jgi:tetraacyldisaccharide 4'-kinase